MFLLFPSGDAYRLGSTWDVMWDESSDSGSWSAYVMIMTLHHRQILVMRHTRCLLEAESVRGHRISMDPSCDRRHPSLVDDARYLLGAAVVVVVYREGMNEWGHVHFIFIDGVEGE